MEVREGLLLWAKNGVPKALNEDKKDWYLNKREYLIHKRDCIDLWVHEFWGYGITGGFTKKSNLEGSGFCEMASVIIVTTCIDCFPHALLPSSSPSEGIKTDGMGN